MEDFHFGGPALTGPLSATCSEIRAASVAEVEIDMPTWTGAVCVTVRGVRVELQQRCMPLVSPSGKIEIFLFCFP